MNTLFADIRNWIRKPFDASGSAFNWLLFVGIIVIAVWLWSTVLAHIKE